MDRVDLFRTEHRMLTDEEVALVLEIKAKANEMNRLLDTVHRLGGKIIPKRALGVSSARTKLQECVFWATHGISAE